MKKAKKKQPLKRAQEAARPKRRPRAKAAKPDIREDPDAWMKSSDAARFLGLSLNGLARLRREGRGPAFRRMGQNRVVYQRRDLLAYQERFPSYRSTSEETVAGSGGAART